MFGSGALGKLGGIFGALRAIKVLALSFLVTVLAFMIGFYVSFGTINHVIGWIAPNNFVVTISFFADLIIYYFALSVTLMVYGWFDSAYEKWEWKGLVLVTIGLAILGYLIWAVYSYFFP